jgi:hypothetical protein
MPDMDEIEDQLIMACERMGYGLDINTFQGYVEVNTGDASRARKDRHRFKTVTLALMWVESRERSIKNLGSVGEWK